MPAKMIRKRDPTRKEMADKTETGIIVVAFLLFRRKQIKKEISQIETENAQNTLLPVV